MLARRLSVDPPICLLHTLKGWRPGVTCMPWKSAAFTLFTQEVINLHVCGQLHKLFLVMGPCVRKGLRGFNNDLQLTWLPTQQWLSERPTAAKNLRQALLPEVLNYENI